MSSDELLDATVATAADLGAGCHVHLAEVREEFVDAHQRWGHSAIHHADAIGLLDHDVVAGHVIWVRPDEYELLAERRVAAIYNPVANMILADGVCAVRRLQSVGVRVGIGTDGAASNDSQDMIGALKTGALLQKVTAMDPEAATAEDMMDLATIGGARALGLESSIGSIEVGKQADLVRFHGDRPGLASVHDPYAQVVYCAGPIDVGDVWVAGRRVYAEGLPTEVDLAEVVATSREQARRLARVADLPLSHLLPPT